MASHIADIFETMQYGPAPESAAPANAWLDAHERRFGMFIDGVWTPPPPPLPPPPPKPLMLLPLVFLPINCAVASSWRRAARAARRARGDRHENQTRR